MLLNLLKILVVFVSVMLYGCAAAVVGAVGYPIEAAQWEEKAVRAEATLKPFVEFVEVEINNNITTSTLHSAKILVTVLEDDMKSVKSSSSGLEKELSNTLKEEMLRFFSIKNTTINNSSPETLFIQVFYAEGRQSSRNRYYSNAGGFFSSFASNEEQLNRWRGIRKGVDVRFTLRRGDKVLLEARGLWGGNDKADEIAGARQLAKELANAILKKLNSPASRSATTEAKKD